MAGAGAIARVPHFMTGLPLLRATIAIWLGCSLGGALGGLVGFAAGMLLDQAIGYNVIVLVLAAFGAGVVVGAAWGSRWAAKRQPRGSRRPVLVGTVVAIGLLGVLLRPLLGDVWQTPSALAVALWIIFAPVAAHVWIQDAEGHS